MSHNIATQLKTNIATTATKSGIEYQNSPTNKAIMIDTTKQAINEKTVIANIHTGNGVNSPQSNKKETIVPIIAEATNSILSNTGCSLRPGFAKKASKRSTKYE